MFKYTKTLVLTILILGIAVFTGTWVGKYFGEKKKLKEKQEISSSILSQMHQLNIGDNLPNHRFEVLGGDSIWLNDILSERSVLMVVLPQCEDCINEVRELKAVVKDTSDSKHFIFASWENPRLLEEMKEETGLNSYFLYDHKNAYFSRFDIRTYPFNITLDKNGVVLDMLAGEMWKEDFEEIIEFNNQASTWAD